MPVAEMEALVGIRSSRTRKFWTHDLTPDDTIPLDDQLRSVRQFIEEKKDTFKQIRDAEINLYITWTPREEHDRVVFDLDLIGLLVEANCFVLLDTLTG